MPDRIAHGEAFSPKSGYGKVRAPKVSGFETKSSKGASGSRSVKKLVRSLSDRYAAVTSPLTCKKKTACSSRNPALKTMKTTAATSLFPLKPAFSATCKSGTQSVAHASSRLRTNHMTSASHRVHTTPSIALPKRLLHMQALGCKEAPLSTTAHTRIVKWPLIAEEDKLTLIAPSSAVAHFCLSNPNGSRNANSAIKQVMEKSLKTASPIESNASCHRQTHPLSQALSYRTNQDWQQFEALLKLKDDEIESIQTAGLMLKELCMKQDEEIKTLKAAFPATLNEMAQLREACERQEKELAYSRVALPAMQAQVTALTDQLKSLTEDLAQMKACKEASSEKVSSHFHEREASNSSSGILSREPSPIMNGFLEHLRRSRRGQNSGTPCEDQRLLPVRVGEAAGSSCSSVTSTDRSCEMPFENKHVSAKHKRGFSAVLSVEHMLKGSGKRSGRRLATDKEIVDTLQELHKAANKEQDLLQERCANAVKELRSSSSRFASLEPIKSILTCTSPQLFEDPPEDEEINLSPQRCEHEVNMWNLKPT